MSKLIPHYKVYGDIDTGEWVCIPIHVGEVLEEEWRNMVSTRSCHYDIYEEPLRDKNGEASSTESETRAITVIFFEDQDYD